MRCPEAAPYQDRNDMHRALAMALDDTRNHHLIDRRRCEERGRQQKECDIRPFYSRLQLGDTIGSGSNAAFRPCINPTEPNQNAEVLEETQRQVLVCFAVRNEYSEGCTRVHGKSPSGLTRCAICSTDSLLVCGSSTMIAAIASLCIFAPSFNRLMATLTTNDELINLMLHRATRSAPDLR